MTNLLMLVNPTLAKTINLLLFIGLAMCVYPYFIASQLILWSITAALVVLPLWVKHHA